MTTISLPWPPAVNNLYANAGKRRIRSARYEAWLADAAACIWEQRPPRISGPYHVRILLDRPDRIRRDIDGLAKACIDLLVKHAITSDDSLVESLSLAWSAKPPSKPGAAHVTIFQASPSIAVAA